VADNTLELGTTQRITDALVAQYISQNGSITEEQIRAIENLVLTQNAINTQDLVAGNIGVAETEININLIRKVSTDAVTDTTLPDADQGDTAIQTVEVTANTSASRAIRDSLGIPNQGPILEKLIDKAINLALNQIPGGKKFDPNVSPKSDDPLARKKYEIQLRAYQVQVLIDDFYSAYGDNNTSKKKNALVGLIKKVRSILEEVLGIEPTQELSPEQQIEQEASGLSVQESLRGNSQIQQVRELVGKDGLRDAELVAAFPELQLFSNFLEDVYSVFNKYSDVRNFPSQEVQKALKKIDDVRTIAISIQNLTSVTGAINLADRFLDGKISKFIKMISKIIDPKKIIPFLKTIIDVCRVIIRIANQILRVISFFSKIISLFLLLVKIFWILRKFFFGIPIPNLVTTVGVTTTVADTLQEIVNEKGFLMFLKRLKQIEEFHAIVSKRLNDIFRDFDHAKR
jgi:hypothetical protein